VHTTNSFHFGDDRQTAHVQTGWLIMRSCKMTLHPLAKLILCTTNIT